MFYYNKHQITKSDIANVSKSLKSELITKGPFLKKFEEKICEKFKSKYSLVTSNATSSFYIISKVLIVFLPYSNHSEDISCPFQRFQT